MTEVITGIWSTDGMVSADEVELARPLLHKANLMGRDEAIVYGRPWRFARLEEPEQADGMTQAKAREFVEWRGCEVEVT